MLLPLCSEINIFLINQLSVTKPSLIVLAGSIPERRTPPFRSSDWHADRDGPSSLSLILHSLLRHIRHHYGQ